jgi:hypothetical protein
MVAGESIVTPRTDVARMIDEGRPERFEKARGSPIFPCCLLMQRGQRFRLWPLSSTCGRGPYRNGVSSREARAMSAVRPSGATEGLPMCLPPCTAGAEITRSFPQGFADLLGRGANARDGFLELLGGDTEGFRPVPNFVGIIDVNAFVVRRAALALVVAHDETPCSNGSGNSGLP